MSLVSSDEDEKQSLASRVVSVGEIDFGVRELFSSSLVTPHRVPLHLRLSARASAPQCAENLSAQNFLSFKSSSSIGTNEDNSTINGGRVPALMALTAPLLPRP